MVAISKIKVWSYIVLILGIFLFSGANVRASELGLQDNDIDVSTIPENPEPYQNVTIKLNSYAADLNKAFIEWRNGNKLLLSGYGKTSYSFQTLGPDVPISFNVTITLSDSGDKVTKIFTINPSEIELMWEGVNSYTPPFYRGKSFPTREGGIRVVAIPNTTTIKQGKGNISYTWKNNDTVIQGVSGYGKDSYIFSNDQLRTKENVTVIASSIDGKYNATKNIDIPISSPKMIFYKKSPTEGVLYNKALTDGTFVSDDEFTIVAEPYFLSLKGNENSFSYDWKINGESIATPSRGNELTVHPSSRGGYATINLVLENLSFLFQKVSGKLSLSL